MTADARVPGPEPVAGPASLLLTLLAARRGVVPVRTDYKGAGVTKAERADTYERDSYRCVYCGSPENLTIDHIVPRAYGGTNDRANLQTLCARCNSNKGNRLVVTRRAPVVDA